MIKSHCFAVSAFNFNWLSAYLRSSTVKLNVPAAFAVTIWLSPSNSSTIFGIWYLLLKNCLFIGLASNANLIESSFLTLMTMGAKKQWLVHISNRLIWPSAKSNSNFFPTLSCICIGFLLPFSWLGHNGYLNFVFTTWFIDRPYWSNKPFWIE